MFLSFSTILCFSADSTCGVLQAEAPPTATQAKKEVKSEASEAVCFEKYLGCGVDADAARAGACRSLRCAGQHPALS